MSSLYGPEDLFERVAVPAIAVSQLRRHARCGRCGAPVIWRSPGGQKHPIALDVATAAPGKSCFEKRLQPHRLVCRTPVSRLTPKESTHGPQNPTFHYD